MDKEFPNLCRDSIVLPIRKHDKPPTDPSSYRSISLTCTMCKLREKILNKRLLWYLQKHKILDPAQSGFRSNRSTADNLLLLQSHIITAFQNKQDVIAAAFDIKNAFHTVYRPNILAKVKECYITGNMYSLIENFLQNRTFKVTANGKTSSIYNHEKGVPQGSVLSPT
ncbi:hypothetical protein JTB14_034862 [Gonioctena quinquepunctata]|nr:hypothetical protein JTB14_034862 [Gonioctena quinquepunctata]